MEDLEYFKNSYTTDQINEFILKSLETRYDQQTLTVKELAYELSYKPQTIRNAISEGRLNIAYMKHDGKKMELCFSQ